jgi:hydroxymethylpyrimidine/phosphomethylpyrimidine kinase
MATTPVALTIAGSDPSGGAGIQADLKTFHQFGVYGASVITLLTVQNSTEVASVDPLDPGYVERQLAAVLVDIPPQAAKTGALGSAAVVEAIARHAAQFVFPLVVDPVMISKHGTALLDPGARQALIEKLLPCAFVVTPNAPEATALAGIEIDSQPAMKEAARRIAALGPRAVLIKGGHLSGDATDVLYYQDRFELFTSPRIDTKNTHGTGCTYSAAITAELAKGTALPEAVARAKRFMTRAIATAPGLGHGYGPVNHFAATD